MHKRAFALAVILLMVPVLIYAGTTGKVRGRVIDKDTKDPIPGVAIILEGTMMGAAPDINGYYIILNVPVGTYSVRADDRLPERGHYQQARVSRPHDRVRL